MSKLSQEALEQVEVLEKTFNGSILIYTINNKKKLEMKNKIRKSYDLWDKQIEDDDNEIQFKRPKSESAVVLAEIVKVADDAPEIFKDLIGRFVYVNGLVGKTYWLSKTEIEELTWVDSSAIYALVAE